jgi:hypothetical protein
MNESVEEPLQIRLQNNISVFSITSFLFYFFYFLIFVFLCFFIIAYFYPDSSFRNIYNYFLKEISGKPSPHEDKSKNNPEKDESILEINTTQEILVPDNNKISLDDAVDQYMELQNQANSNLGKINYLPPRQYTNKEGSCLIGNDRGFNSCINVGRNDYCMSGDIYPTKDICINPSLRL